MSKSLRSLPISKTMPINVGVIHLVGIGGIGISSIAEILHNLGYAVQGSDIADNANIARLRIMGIKIHIGHKASNLGEASVLVKSTAVSMNNPEIIEARSRRIPVVHRSEMLAELMRLRLSIAVAGTHGKTTTTSLTACILDAADMQPTVINGGIINAYGANAKLGTGEWMVVEADESDGTFIRLPITVAIITNIDAEHLEYYGSFTALKAAFAQFIDNLPFYGFAVMCIDHSEVQSLFAEITDRRVITYGLSPQADLRAINICSDDSAQIFSINYNGKIIKDFRLPMFGEHNLLNSLASIVVALELGISFDIIKKALINFSGVKRRFTYIGEINGVKLIDDYAHHPVEIAATLSSARQAVGIDNKVIAVMQPHRYTRLRDLWDDFCKCFNDANIVIITEIYEAGESPLEHITQENFVHAIEEYGHKKVILLSDFSELKSILRDIANKNDIIICMGAGNISSIVNGLVDE